MDSPCIRMRMNEDCDRLSSLPDDLICKILSSLCIRYVIELSILSSRWRYVWTSMTVLNLSSQGFPKVSKFHKFLTRVLSLCKSQVQLTLDLHGKVRQVRVQKVLNTISNNIRQLTFHFLRDNPSEFPLSVFSSKSLKHLTLFGYNKHGHVLTPTSTWELPALTTLYLEQVTLRDDDKDKCVTLISKCTNLKNLTLVSCSIESSSLTISHPQLSNLTVKEWYRASKAVNVVAPQLKNLSIMNCIGEHIVSAPNLTSLVYRNYSFKLNVFDNLYLLEKVVLCVQKPSETDAHKLVGLLHKFNNVKYLEVSLEIVELLSKSDLLSHKPSPFVNLTRLTIIPEIFEEEELMDVTEVKNYLRDSSSATLIMVSREEKRAERDTILAGNLMSELMVFLENEKASMKCYTENRMQRQWMEMPPSISLIQAQMKCDNEKRMQQPWLVKIPPGVSQTQALVKSYLQDQRSQLSEEEAKCEAILTYLGRIEGLLKQLPVSMQSRLQPRFDRSFAEARTVLKGIVDQGKNIMDMNYKEIINLGKGA